MTFEHLNTIFHHLRGKQKQPVTFWYCVDSFYPWKDIVGKKVSKLRAIVEVRAFYKQQVNPLLSMNKYTLHAISRKDKNKQLIIIKRTQTAINKLFAL